MKINLSPMRRDDTLTIVKTGEILTLNDVVLDFSPLMEGATLPRSAITCDWIVSDVTRSSGEIELTVILPHGANASEVMRFPEPILVTEDGQVPLPQDEIVPVVVDDYSEPVVEVPEPVSTSDADMSLDEDGMTTSPDDEIAEPEVLIQDEAPVEETP